MRNVTQWPQEPDSVRKNTFYHGHPFWLEFVKTDSFLYVHGAGEIQEFCKTGRCRSDNDCIFISPTDECGIVAQISEPLAAADIPAYYISTFKFDHALVSIKTASLK